MIDHFSIRASINLRCSCQSHGVVTEQKENNKQKQKKQKKKNKKK